MSRNKSKSLRLEQLEQRLTMAAQAVGSSILVNDYIVRNQTTENSSQAVATNSVNQVFVFEGKGAHDRHGVFAKVRNASGETTVATFQVNTTTLGEQHSPSVAVEADGDFIVVWAGRGVGDKEGIFFQRFTASGTKVGSETLVNTTIGGTQSSPIVAVAPDGAFTIAWAGVGTGDASGVFMRRYTAAGVAATDEVRINTTTTNDQASPDIAIDSLGNLIAVWTSRDQDGSDWGVYARRFNSSGVAQGSEFAINSTTNNSQMAPDVTIDPTGGFLVAWQSFAQDGAGWGVVARRFTNLGVTDGAEFVLNNETAGNQHSVSVAFDSNGRLFATWVTSTTDGHGWEVAARLYTPSGAADGSSFIVNQSSSGANSGHQHSPFVVASGDAGLIVWSGRGATDRRGVYAQRYDTDQSTETQQPPNLAAIADEQASVGVELEVLVTATDPNSGDTLTYTLDPDNSPAGATITKLNNNSAIIRWTPTASSLNTTVTFRVIVTDNGQPPLSDSEEFQVAVGEESLVIDLNGPDESGNNNSVTFVTGSGAVSIVDSDLSITFPAGGNITGAWAQLAATPNGAVETLSVDTLDTAIVAEYSSTMRTLVLTGNDTAENYARVLRTLRYNNTAPAPSGSRSVSISVSSGSLLSNTAIASLEVAAADLVAFAQALTNAGARLFGAGWSADTTAQKELFEDGAQFLTFVESTNPNRTPNQVAVNNNITTYPTWIFQDGSRLTGVQSLQALAEHLDIDIPVSAQPFIAPIANATLLIGSPLLVPLDGYDPNGGPLNYTVTTNNTGVTAQVLEGNRSARIKVAGYGDMVFELLEDFAPRATNRMIELAEDDFYKDIIFHRVMDNFVIQGGDPTGTGTGGSTLGDFDDQFHPDLQHNRTGILSMAKSGDDTNDSQFFITEGAQRHLDFNHTIFGMLTEGEAVRNAISGTAVTSTRPDFDVVMEGIEIFEDQENAVLMLKAAPGTSGPVTVTVTVTDQNGNTFQRVFQVAIATDTSNSPPFLNDIGPVSAPRNTVAQVQLSAVDVENDPVFYTAQKVGSVDYTVTVSSTGLVQVTPPQGFVGTVQVRVGVGSVANNPDDTQLITVQFT